MRDYGAIRSLFVPDLNAPDDGVQFNYEGVARTQLGILKNLMSFNNLQQLCRTVVLPDGTEIFVQSVYGQDTIRITPPSATIEAPGEIPQTMELLLPSTIIVGASGNGGEPPVFYPCMWVNGLVKALPTPANTTGLAAAISKDLSTIVGVIGSSPGVWDRQSLSYLTIHSLPIPPYGGGYDSGYATCVDRTGSKVIGYTPNATNDIGFIWDKSTGIASALPSLAPTDGYKSRPLGCSIDATTIVGFRHTGYSGYTPAGSLPLIWQQDPITLEYSVETLPLPSGMTNGLAQGVNADGTVIIGSAYYVSPSNVPDYNHNVVWVNGEVIDLGVGASGVDVSDDGNTLLVWTENGHSATIGRDEFGNYTQYTDLGNPPASPSGSSLTAYAISPDGTVVVGSTGYSAFNWKGGQYGLLQPSVTGYIGYAYDVGILSPDPDSTLTIPISSVPA